MEAIKVNLIPNGIPQMCHASQYDEGRQIRLDLFDGFTPYVIQSGDTFTLNVRKPDNHVIIETVTGTEGETHLVIETTEQMTAVMGKNLCEIRVENDGDNIGSLNFIMQVEKDVIANGIPSESVIEDLDALVAGAVGDDFYTKSEVNDLVGGLIDDESTANNKTWSSEKIDEAFEAVEEQLNDYLIDKYETVNPTNWFNGNATTSGILKADGTTEASDEKLYTDYIPVVEDDVIRAYYGNVNMPAIYMRNICCYDASKTVLSSKGSDSSKTSWTVSSGVSFVRVTIDTMYAAKAIITRNLVPTSYTEYFEPYEVLGEDFLTPESQEAVDKVKNRGFSTKDLANKYACALPKSRFYQTIGLAQSWYYKNMATPPTDNIYVSIGPEFYEYDNDKITFTNATAVSSVNGYVWEWYDSLLALIEESKNVGYGWGRSIVAENLSDCSLLAIGDSTVDQDVMTQSLLDHFTSEGHTLTLLGTLGTGLNKNEGRAGWKASDYFTDKQYQGVTNPFYNPTTQTFDFSYYMAQQNYNSVDFVVIQLGINDLYNYDESAIAPLWENISLMIDSVLAFNNSIKVILDLITPPTSNQSTTKQPLFKYRNRVVRYNELALAQSLSKYGTSKVRCSYCHLILDPDNDIRDNVHPTDNGYGKMALEIVNQINCWQNGV